MPNSSHDSAIVTLDKIKFRYATRRRFDAYLIVVSSDTLGRVNVYESPLTYPILHRPALNKPATLDFPGTGFIIHTSIGKVPDVVRYDVFLVRDRRTVRRAGEILQRLSDSPALQAVVNVAKVALTVATGGTGAVVAAVATAIGPVIKLIGELLEQTQDRVLEAYAGSQVFDHATLNKTELSETIVSSTGNIEAEIDIMLFDSHVDQEDLRDLARSVVKLGRRGGTEFGQIDEEGTPRPASYMIEL